VGVATLLLAFSLPAALCAATGPVWEQGTIKPSANKGKTGQYHCETSQKGYNYFVYVPKNYSDANPAGIHIFYHGQASQGSAHSFDLWAGKLLEPYNLIGINMEYEDGDNAKDTGGKVRASEEAVAQVMADYKIVKGRGIISSFSGGGLPHGDIYTQYGQKNCPRAVWPFNHTAIYDTNFLKSASGGLPMSWSIALGTEEWSLANLGSTQSHRAQELFGDAAKGACPDIYFKIDKGKGHTIIEDDVAATADCFARSDLAYAPFIYAPDYTEKELAPIVSLANSMAYGKAATMLDKVLADTKAAPAVKEKAGALKKLLDARIDKIIALAKDLTANDPVLGNFYGNLFLQQLTGLPRQKEVKDLVIAMQKDKGFRNALAAFDLFTKQLGAFFSGNKLSSGMVPALEQIKQLSGEKSLIGRLAADYLLLKE
jgi:hypothetical protein